MKFTTILPWLLLPGLLLSRPAFAAEIAEILLAGKPSSRLENGLTEMCSVRVVGIKDAAAPDQPTDGIDFSFSLGTQGGLIKIAAYDVSGSKQKKQKPIIAPIKAAWLKMSAGEIAGPLDGKFRANLEAFGSVMYDTGVDAIASLFDDLHSGLPIQIWIQRAGENEIRVYTGIVRLSDTDQKQISGCLENLVKSIEARKQH